MNMDMLSGLETKMNGNQETIRKIYIRADGNDVIATGHIMRCLSIADQIKKLGAEVTFVTADEAPRSLIEGRGFEVDVLGTTWNDLDGETGVICRYVVERKVRVLLIDSYYVTEDYLGSLSDITNVVYIDDLYAFGYPVNALINYAVFSDINRYHELYRNEKEPYYLVGGDYVPIREEFINVSSMIRDRVGKIMITTGGTDRLNVTGNLLKAVLVDEELSRLEYHVIVGRFNQNKDMLSELAETSDGHFILHENVTQMSEYMTKCDVAVSASGSTLYELCACGTPTICLEIADNQNGACRWEQEGYMRYAGNAAEDMNACISTCIIKLKELKTDFDARLNMSKRTQSLVDGKGAERIARYLLNGI